jgi:hypothetical protein
MTEANTAARPWPRLTDRTEKGEQAAIVDLLRYVGASVWVLGTRRPRGDYPGTRQTPGLPDVMAFLPPSPGGKRWVLLCIEVKRGPRERLRPGQQAFRELCQLAGISHVVGPFEAVWAWLRDHGYVRRSE